MTGFSRILPIVAALPVVLLAGACAREPETAAVDALDPVVAAALADPLMTDPELATRNPGGDGFQGLGPPDGTVPPLDTSQAEIDRAREAARLLAGGSFRKVPPSVEGKPAPVALTPALLAARLPGPACGPDLSYSAIWAARLPEPLTPYPRAHVIDGAGLDARGCALRLVRMVTPVSPDDALAFHVTRLNAAGWPAIHRKAGEASVLTGGNAATVWRIEVRPREDGLTGIDLAVKSR